MVTDNETLKTGKNVAVVAVVFSTPTSDLTQLWWCGYHDSPNNNNNELDLLFIGLYWTPEAIYIACERTHSLSSTWLMPFCARNFTIIIGVVRSESCQLGIRGDKLATMV